MCRGHTCFRPKRGWSGRGEGNGGEAVETGAERQKSRAVPHCSAHQPGAIRGAGTSGAASAGLALGAQVVGLRPENQGYYSRYWTMTAAIAPPKVQATKGHAWVPSVTRLSQF